MSDNENELTIGEIDKNGWRYATISKSTLTPLWVFPSPIKDVCYTEAIDFCNQSKMFNGYKGSFLNTIIMRYYAFMNRNNLVEYFQSNADDGGFRLPSLKELEQIRENKEALLLPVEETEANYLALEMESGSFSFSNCINFQSGKKVGLFVGDSANMLVVRTEKNKQHSY